MYFVIILAEENANPSKIGYYLPLGDFVFLLLIIWHVTYY